MKGMKSLEAESVDCIITSPPYWQLRDYGFADQWGLEPTYQEYLEHLWQFMSEANRVLKKTGTAWINLGDTYGKSGESGGNQAKLREAQPIKRPNIAMDKCLLLIPHRFAIGCIDRGWILRNDIIWAKRNGMPESVTDRFSKKHEFIFMFAKSKKYYFDLDGIRDKTGNEATIDEYEQNKIGSFHNHDSDSQQGMMQKKVKGYKAMTNPAGKNPGTVSDFWDYPTKPSSESHYASYNDQLLVKPIIAGCPENGIVLDPFCGTGTTLTTAVRLNRGYIGFDGKQEYIDICKERLYQTEGLFA